MLTILTHFSHFSDPQVCRWHFGHFIGFSVFFMKFHENSAFWPVSMGKPDTFRTVKNTTFWWKTRGVLKNDQKHHFLTIFDHFGHFREFPHSQPVKYLKIVSFDRSVLAVLTEWWFWTDRYCGRPVVSERSLVNCVRPVRHPLTVYPGRLGT